MEQQLDSRLVLLLEATVADAVGLTIGIASVGDAVGEASLMEQLQRGRHR